MTNMDAERFRQALRDYGIKNQLSVSDMFSKSGNSPSTGTRFMRGQTENLNGKTIGSLFHTFKGLEDLYQGRKDRGKSHVTVPVVGMVRGLKVGVLQFGLSNGYLEISKDLLKQHGDCAAILTASVKGGNYANWVWIVRTEPISLEEAETRMVFIDTVAGNYFGCIETLSEDVVNIRGISNLRNAEFKVNDIEKIHPVVAAFPPAPIDSAPHAVII